MQLVTTKQKGDHMHRAFLSSWESHTAQPSPGQPPAGGRLLERACLHFSWTGGAGTVARGLWGIPNRYSARRGGASPRAEPAQCAWQAPGSQRTTSPRRQCSAGPAAALPAASLVLRILPAFPLPRSRRSPLHSQRLLPLEAHKRKP